MEAASKGKYQDTVLDTSSSTARRRSSCAQQHAPAAQHPFTCAQRAASSSTSAQGAPRHSGSPRYTLRAEAVRRVQRQREGAARHSGRCELSSREDSRQPSGTLKAMVWKVVAEVTAHCWKEGLGGEAGRFRTRRQTDEPGRTGWVGWGQQQSGHRRQTWPTHRSNARSAGRPQRVEGRWLPSTAFETHLQAEVPHRGRQTLCGVLAIAGCCHLQQARQPRQHLQVARLAAEGGKKISGTVGGCAAGQQRQRSGGSTGRQPAALMKKWQLGSSPSLAGGHSPSLVPVQPTQATTPAHLGLPVIEMRSRALKGVSTRMPSRGCTPASSLQAAVVGRRTRQVGAGCGCLW